MNRLQQLRDLVNSLETDFSKFYEKENHAAGARLRKGMQEIKRLCQEIRIEVQSKKKAG